MVGLGCVASFDISRSRTCAERRIACPTVRRDPWGTGCSGWWQAAGRSIEERSRGCDGAGASSRALPGKKRRSDWWNRTAIRAPFPRFAGISRDPPRPRDDLGERRNLGQREASCDMGRVSLVKTHHNPVKGCRFLPTSLRCSGDEASRTIPIVPIPTAAIRLEPKGN